jgi:hypothetical protein
VKTTLHYSEALIRRAVVAWWRRHFDWKFWSAVVVTTLSTAYLGVIGEAVWLVGASGAILVLGLSAAAWSFVFHSRSSMHRLRSLGRPEATLELHETHLRMESGAGVSEIPWRLLKEVAMFPDFWLVFLSETQSFTLPTADLNEEIRSTLAYRVIADGGKVA